jgi:hypothetical protein
MIFGIYPEWAHLPILDDAIATPSSRFCWTVNSLT